MSLRRPGRRGYSAPATLYTQFLPFTHGGNYWRDNYLLERWAKSNQPVVYRDDCYQGYKLLRRLGNWCWLTRHPKTNDYYTLKFLSRPANQELAICQYIKKNAQSPFICKISDHFRIPHHLAHTSEHRDIEFDVIVYPVMGSDIRRACMGEGFVGDEDDLVLDLERRERIIRQVIRGVAELHRIEVVHGDLHAGNIALPRPSAGTIERILSKLPLEHKIERRDGQPTQLKLPNRVTEPEYIGFGGTDGCMIFDFGFSFHPLPGVAYDMEDFPLGIPCPPELLRQESQTNLPYKVDSWQLGLLIYYLLTNGYHILDSDLPESDFRDQHDQVITELRKDKDVALKEVPEAIRRKYLPVLISLLDADPGKRLSVVDLSQDEQFMLDI